MKRIDLLYFLSVLISFPALHSPAQAKEPSLGVSRGQETLLPSEVQVYPPPSFELRKNETKKNDWRHRIHFQAINHEPAVPQNPIHYSGRASDWSGSSMGGEMDLRFGKDDR